MIYRGLGQYEIGVEAKAEEPLGVFLEKMRGPRFVYEGQPIDVRADLRIEAVESDLERKITIDCYSDKNPENKGILARDSYDVVPFERSVVQCTMDSAKLGSVRDNIVLEAKFKFTTNAFLKSYFMEQSRIREFERPEFALQEFGITEVNPVAIYTGGPLYVGIGVGQQPIPLINPDINPGISNIGPLIDVTFNKNQGWSAGEFESFESITITLPPGLEMGRIKGYENVCLASTSSTGESVCELSSKILAKMFPVSKPGQPISMPVSFGITTTVTDQDTILASAPLAIRSFKVDATYKYRIKKKIAVDVRKIEEVI